MHLRLHAAFLATGLVCAQPPEPKLSSIHPFAGRAGAPFEITVRGNALKGANSIVWEGKSVAATIVETAVEPLQEGARSKTPFDLVRIRVDGSAASPGTYEFRLIGPGGISNSLPIEITAEPVFAEPPGTHETPETAVVLPALPTAVAGRISRRGEADLFLLEGKAGETVTLRVASGLPSFGRPGGNAVGFDPSITILEPSASWFDSKRLNRVAFNDEPLWILGKLTDAHLVFRFPRTGRYYVRIEAFSGQGGPDYSYQLKAHQGAHSPAPELRSREWEERGYNRTLAANRLNQLAERGGTKQDRKIAETYRGAVEPAPFALPGTLEGTLDQPGLAHRARFRADGPQDIAIEIETPAAAPPVFNPVVRLLNAEGEEVATNIFAGRGACTGALTKSSQSKTIIPLRDSGEYTVEIRDVTADIASPDFRYRVQVRPQVPHIGQVRIDEDHINLAPEGTKTVRVTFDREEDYRGAIAVSAEGLPQGVAAITAADFEPDKDPPPSTGKRERYVPRTERAVVLFAAASDAAPTGAPHTARLVVRPVNGGKLGAIIATKEFPIMVVAKP